MGLCKTSNVSIFTFINASDLKFCPRSYSSCVYRIMRFKGSNGKICKIMTSHFGTLFGVNKFLEVLLFLLHVNIQTGIDFAFHEDEIFSFYAQITMRTTTEFEKNA